MSLSFLFSLVLIAGGAIMCWVFWEDYLVRPWAEFLTTPALFFDAGLFLFVISTIPVLSGIILIISGIIVAIVSLWADSVDNLEGLVEQLPRGTFCENCGNSLKPTTKFCGKCGNQI